MSKYLDDVSKGPWHPLLPGRDMAIDPPARLKIIALEMTEGTPTVSAQFNPKEVQIDSSVPYQPAKKHVGPADLEYTGNQPMAMSFELLFDGYETNTSVVPSIQSLQQMTKPMEQKGKNARPPIVKVIWGADTARYNLPRFNAVIESLSVKYQMFSREGHAVRATVSIKLKECSSLVAAKQR
jgi:hypothetical protein